MYTVYLYCLRKLCLTLSYNRYAVCPGRCPQKFHHYPRLSQSLLSPGCWPILVYYRCSMLATQDKTWYLTNRDSYILFNIDGFQVLLSKIKQNRNNYVEIANIQCRFSYCHVCVCLSKFSSVWRNIFHQWTPLPPTRKLKFWSHLWPGQRMSCRHVGMSLVCGVCGLYYAPKQDWNDWMRKQPCSRGPLSSRCSLSSLLACCLALTHLNLKHKINTEADTTLLQLHATHWGHDFVTSFSRIILKIQPFFAWCNFQKLCTNRGRPNESTKHDQHETSPPHLFLFFCPWKVPPGGKNVPPMSLGQRSNNMSHRIVRTCC